MFNLRYLSILIMLMMLSGCAGSLKDLHRKHPISYYDDSKEVDGVRVSCKRITYDRKHDCTLIKCTINNNTLHSCILSPEDINAQLVSQETANNIFMRYNRNGHVISRALLHGLTGALIGSLIAVIVEIPLIFYKMLFNEQINRKHTLLPVTLFAATGGYIGYYKTTHDRYDKHHAYYCQQSGPKVTAPCENNSLILLIKGKLIHRIPIIMHGDQERHYMIELNKKNMTAPF